MAAIAVEREDEGVAQHAANGAGFDLGALGRPARPALLFPIGVKFAACGVFHDQTRSRTRAPPPDTSVPDWDKDDGVWPCGCEGSRRCAAGGLRRPAAAATSG